MRYLPWFQLSDPYRDARDDGARPAGAPQRPRPGRRRPAVVAAVHLHAGERWRDRLRFLPLGHQLPQRLRLRQRALPGRGRGDRSGQRAVVGGLHPHPHPGARRDDDQPPRFDIRGQRRQRRHAARARSTSACARCSRSPATTPTQPAASSRTPPTWRRGCACCCGAASWPTAAACSPSARGGPLSTLVTPMPNRRSAAELAPLASFVSGYALGLNVRDYRGHLVLTHTGGLPGYCLAGAPGAGHRARRVGADQPGVGRGLQRARLLRGRSLSEAQPRRLGGGIPGVRAAESSANCRRRNTRPRKRELRPRRPSLPLARYAGTYVDPVVRRHRDHAGRRHAGDSLHEDALRWSAISSTGSTTPSSRAGAIASCARTRSSPSRSSRTARSTGPGCRPSRRRRTSASISRIWC